MAEITHGIRGTVTLEPGGDVVRVLDLPAGFPDVTPDFYLSRITPVDPADLGLFRFSNFGTCVESGRDSFAGVRQFTITYTLTGPDPIDVSLSLVFVDGAFGEVSYGGV